LGRNTLRVFTKTKENKENRKKQFDYNTGKKNELFSYVIFVFLCFLKARLRMSFQG
jgi:hypothetical protein